MKSSRFLPSARRRRHTHPGGRDLDREEAIPATFSALYQAEPRTAQLARHALCDFATAHGASPEKVLQIALAVSEAVTNVVVHAYGEHGEGGAVEVSAAMTQGGELWVIVTDTGSGLRADGSRQGLGLGLAIIAQMADGIDLAEPTHGGLELRMRFVLEVAG